MAKTDHTRLRQARSAAPDKSTDNRRDPPPTIATDPPPIADARSHTPTHPRWALPAAISRTAPIAWGHGLPPGPFREEDTYTASSRYPLEDDDGSDDMPATGAWSDEVQCAALDAEELRAVCRTVSDIHAQLALAYAYALTFSRAVRDYIPLDELDILPCLSTGVLDTLDTQLPRLDALLDHLARAACAAHRVPAARAVPQSVQDSSDAPAFRQRIRRHSRRREVDSTEVEFSRGIIRPAHCVRADRDADPKAEAASGDTAVRSTL